MTTGNNNAPVGPMGILGDAFIGGTLLARPNAIKDDDGINFATASFQWLRDGQPITGATSQSYNVISADAGAALSVRYSYTDMLGNPEAVTSNPKIAVPNAGSSNPIIPDGTPVTPPGTSNPNNSDPVGPLNILGDALVGQALTARPNSISDADGINFNTVSFQWLRDGEAITGETSQTYSVTAADRGAALSVQYIYLDEAGTRETVTSNPKPAVPGGTVVTPPIDTGSGGGEEPTPPTPTPPTTPPAEHINSVPIGKLVILGFPVEGADLLARTDAVFDRDGFDRGSGTFQWLRDGEPITGATAQTYTITAEDRGAAISVQLAYTDNYGTQETVVSDPEPPVPFPAGEGPNGRDDVPDVPVGEGTSSGGVLEGTPQADTLVATADLQRIDGLDSVDTAFFAGDQSDYVVSFSPDGVTVTDRKADGLGTIALDNVELIDFGTDLDAFGGAMDLRQYGGQTGLDEAAFESFIEMYIAYFNRAPDAIGLSFWGTAFANGVSLEEIAADFSTQPEMLETYADGISNIKFAAEVYSNVLGRSPDIEGLRFWTGQLDDGNVNRGEFILEILQGVKAAPPADASQAFIDRQLADQAYLEQKTDLGALFAVHRGMSNVEDATAVLSLFDGSAESLTTAADAINTLYDAAMDPLNGDFLMPLVGVLDNPFEA